jgi:hypothetical protein
MQQSNRLKEWFLIGVIVLFGIGSVTMLIGAFWLVFRP